MSFRSTDDLVLYISRTNFPMMTDVTRIMHSVNGCKLVDMDVVPFTVGELSPKPVGGISPKPIGAPGGGLLPFNTVGGETELQKVERTKVMVSISFLLSRL